MSFRSLVTAWASPAYTKKPSPPGAPRAVYRFHLLLDDIENLIGMIMRFIVAARPLGVSGQGDIGVFASGFRIEYHLGIHVEVVERRVCISGIPAIYFHSGSFIGMLVTLQYVL